MHNIFVAIVLGGPIDALAEFVGDHAPVYLVEQEQTDLRVQYSDQILHR
jgi:hypothetical protein